MIASEERHYKECKLGDKCERCFWITEAKGGLLEAQEEIEAKTNQPKPQVKTKLAYNYRLKEWRDEVIK